MEFFMKICRALLGLFLVVAVAVSAMAAERVDSKIRFNDLYGEVSIRPNDEEDDAYEFAELDTIIYEEDRIRTKEESGAILGLADMSTFVVKPETVMIIRTPNEETTKFEMIAGTLWANVKQMAEGKTINVEMSQCVAGIKGTTVKFVQTPTVNTIYVAKGLVSVQFPNGLSSNVQAGECLTIKQGEKEPKKDNIVIEELEQEFKKEIEKRGQRLNDDKLGALLIQRTEHINYFIANYKNYRKTHANRLDSLKGEAERFLGELFEVTALVDVANSHGQATANVGDKSLELRELANTAKTAVDSCKALIDEIMNYCESQQGEIKHREDSQTIIANCSKDLDGVYSNVKNLIDETHSGLSYSAFREAKLECNNEMNTLDSIRKTLEDVQIPGHSMPLSLKFNAYYKFVKKAYDNFSSVPEITISTINNMKDYEKIVTDCMSSVNACLKDYNSINSSSVDAKKKYVTVMANALTSFDKTKRFFNKAQRINSDVVRSFKSSAYTTSEYDEIDDCWTKIQEAMDSLGEQAEELNSCLESLKSQLEGLL